MLLISAGTARANVTPAINATFTDPTPGAHSNYAQTVSFTYAPPATAGNVGDDLKRLVLDYPAGMIGDPNAIAPANRCDTEDYNGGAAGTGTPADITATSNSPDYLSCPPSSRVGSINVNAQAYLSFLFIPFNCSANFNGSAWLLRNRPTADPEVPTYLGIRVNGTPTGGGCGLVGDQVINLTAKITLRPDDKGLRITIIDDISDVQVTGLGTAQVAVNSMTQTINGMAPAPSTKPFLTNPTRCDTWTTKAYASAYDSNSNLDADVDPMNGTNDTKMATTTDAVTCTPIAPYNPTFTLTQSNTQAGRPVGLRATLDNPVTTTNAQQPAYAKSFGMTMPVGFRINPAIANRLGLVGCTDAQFNMASPGIPISDTAPTCPAGSEMGTVAVTTPEITGDLTGKIYLGDPQAGDVAARTYRLYAFAARGGVAVKFQGRAVVDQTTGQVVVTFGASPYSTGLPQFNYSKFILDFDTASAGVGSPSSGAVAGPNDNQQMLVNPQVCGSYTSTVALTPWTNPNEGITNLNKTLTVTSGTNGSCSFNAFNPTFSATVWDTGAGKHPDLTLSVTRGDRTDNLRDMTFRLPDGFAGSATAVTPCSAANAAAGTCPGASQVGTVDVLAGAGPNTAALAGNIYLTDPDPGDTAKLAIIVPAVVGPFNLGNVTIYSRLTITGSSSFGLTATTTNIPQSIQGIPVLYRTMTLNLDGFVGGKPFLQNPSTCSALNFQATLTSNGDLSGPATPGSGTVQSVVKTDTDQTVTGCPTPFNPTLAVTATSSETAKPTGLTVNVSVPQTTAGVTGATIQESTIKRIQLTMPTGMEINPGFTSSLTACATAVVDAGGGACPAASKVATVTVNTPLLASPVTGALYIETPGATAATRYKLGLVLNMPGGNQIIHGSATVNGSTDLINGLGAKDSGSGVIVADFPNLPDVPYSQLSLAFDGATPMFINPSTCASQTFSAAITPTTTGGAVANRTSAYTTSYNGSGGACPGSDPWSAANTFPRFTQTVSNFAANAHPNLTLLAERQDKDQQLRDITFGLPAGLTGAPANVPTCTQVNADLGNCAVGTQLGTVTVAIGSGTQSLSVAGTLNNTVSPGTQPAKFTAIVPVMAGPFNLGKMSIPVNVTMRSDYGLDATVTNLPQRYEGIAVRYRSMQILINGVVGGQNFLTNPSKCGLNTTTAAMTSTLSNTVTRTQTYTTTGCPLNFGTAPTFSAVPSTVASQTPTGYTISVGSAATNPTIKRIQVAFPSGTAINPAVGNGPLTACAPATVDAGGAGCPAASDQGNVSITTPLLAGTFTGDVYLETPGATAATRYKLAIVVHLPGRDMIIRGGATVNGSTDGAPAGTGAVDSGTGQVTADFDNIPDLAFSSMVLTLNSGNRALLINPTTCAAQTVNGTITPNSGGANTAPTSGFTTTTNCGTPFTPTFTGSVSTAAANGHPNLTLNVASPDRDLQLRNFNVHLPVGLVANTTATTRCSQANAAAGNCAVGEAVGTVNTSIGNGGESYALSGSIYNVVPNAGEPARLQAVIPVTVGPFNLGKLSIPVSTALRANLGVDANTQLPLRYEGIPVRIRSMQLVLNGVVGGQNFLTNPSKCQVNTVSADMISPTPTTVTQSFNYTTTGCPINYGTAPTLTVTPSTTASQTPVGLTIGVDSAATNPTTKRIQLAMPVGMEVNPAFGNGPLAACAPATVDAGGAGCPATSNVGTVSLTTPLLPAAQTGNVYLETPGTTAATRYKLAIVVHLPGRDLIVRGAVQVNGSTTIAAGGTGAQDSGTGQVTADFDNIPDLGFTNMTLTFNSGNRAMMINPSSCAAQTFNSTLTPNSGGANATPSANYTTTACATTFAPTFSGSVSTAVAGAHPNVTLTATSPDKDLQLRNFNLHLPTGLAANTSATTQCSQASAAAATCVAGQAVGSVSTSIGNGGESYALSGTIYNVVPNAGEPARFSVKIPVLVGPFDLGNLTIPVGTSLRADMGVDTTTQLPLRYEGIAVRVRSLSMVLNGTAGGNSFMTNPSKCQSNTISADMISSAAGTVTGTFNYSTTGCPIGYGTAPTISVTPSTTVAQTPVGLTIGINSNANNPTTKRVQITMPTGMEINPGFGNGPLAACAPATVDAGGAGCPATSNVGTVSLTTPLLTTAQTGNVYLETPGTTATTRYKLAIVVHLPGRDLVVRGAVQVNGSSTIAPGGTGAQDSGTGRVTADFDNITDLGWTNLTLAFNSTPHAMLINPTTCAAQTFGSTLTPHSGGADATPSANYTTTACTSAFAPTFSASLSTAAANGHPNLTLGVTSADKELQLRNFNVHLPTGLVANTTATTRCSQVNAAAGNCAVGEAVGTVSATIGNGGDNLTLTPGSIYNVVPNANEPARLQAVLPVVVGPFDLGKLSIPVTTSLRADMGVDANTQLPLRYEGIAVRVRSMQLVLNGVVGGQNFMTNPSKCQVNTISADMISTTPSTVTGTSSFTTTGCPANYGTAPTLSVTPSTTVAQTPVGLTIGVSSAATNVSTKRIQLAMPAGMEVNPAFGNGPLAACATATINAGGAGCPATSNVGTVSLTTPLLPAAQTGNVYLETPGATATTRYKLAIVIHLPGRDLVVHGSVLVNGSTTIAPGGTGASDSGSGQVTADFDNIPDLGFTNMTLTFNSGNRAMLINPTTCAAQTFNGTITPNSGGTAAAPTANYTTTACTSTFAPTFTGSVSTAAAGGHPNLTLTATSPDKDAQLRNFNVHLPTGLVANTTATTQCAQATATAGNCTAAQAVGTVNTSIGNGGESFALSGSIYNVVPNANEPARLQAVIPVTVGPFDLGKLSIPVGTSLRADLGVDTTTQLPLRYEGIAVRIRSMQLVLNGVVGGQNFMTNPSKCQSNAVSADMISPTPTTVTGSFNFTTTGCPLAFGTAPTLAVTPSTTASQTPVGLTVAVNSNANNPSIKRIQLAMPVGMEVNPAFGNGPLAACAPATVDAGGAGCPATSNVGTVSLTTPLLPAAQTGNVYLETPGATAATRYKLAIVIHLPGRDIVVRGAVAVNGSSTIPGGGTGASDSGTGQVTADFDNIPDLGFTNLTMALSSGNRAMLINSATCAAQTFNSTVTPNSGGADATPTASYTTTTCATSFNPTFTAAVSTNQAGGHPNLTLTATSPDKDLQLRNFNVHLPVGLVANTTATTRCAQATATAGNCTAAQAVGTVNTSIGNGGETFALSGSIYNVVPNANEPARLQAVIPVTVGPFDLGKLSIPVGTSLRADLGVDTTTQLPLRYEGIAVRIRSMQLVLNGVVGGQNFITNPSKCQSNTISADMISPTPTTVTGSSSFTTNGCAALTTAFNPSITSTVNPTTAGAPTALTFGVNIPAESSSVSRVQLTLPPGMEINPGVGNGLVECSTAQIDAGGAACVGNSSNLGTVSLTTPLLPGAQTGNVFLEQHGSTAATRYKLALVIHLPGRDLVVHGSTLVNGSSTIAPGGTGAVDSGTGQITADFNGLPDLGFTNMTVAFNTAGNHLFVNPTSCASHTVNAGVTPNSGSVASPETSNFTTTGCTSPAFNPTFTGSVSTAASGGHPNLTLNVTRGDLQPNLRNFNLHLPTGLVANTSATTQCTQANANAGNCAAGQIVGTANTTIGSGTETYALSGSIYNVVPNANEPARLQAIIPVNVGPFDLGDLTIPVPTSLRADYGIDANAQLPLRYEGIAVHIRSLQLVLSGVVGGNNFMTNPTKCQSNSVSADMISDTPTTVSGTWAYTTTGCPSNFGTTPAFSVTPSTTETQKPVGLSFQVNSAATNPTISRIQMALPAGMEVNPAFGNSLLACSSAQIDAGGALCPAASNVGTVSLTTPLLPAVQTGNVYLETPGTTAATRYKLAIVIHLPGRDMIVRGAVNIDGSTTIASGGPGAIDSGSGQLTADFNGIPDLQFTNLTIGFNSGNRAMLTNPSSCASHTFNSTITPSSGGSNATPSAAYTTTLSCANTFAPSFSASVNSAVAGGHPNLTLTVNRPEKDLRLRNFNVHLPTGLVAATTATTTRCSQANAAAANCAPGEVVGTVNTSIGTGGETLALSGNIYNVVPSASEPARLAAIIPIQVGPFDLGKLSIPVSTSLRADLGVDASTQLPLRYEGIAVRISTMQLVLSGTVSGNSFITNPSKCQSNTISADMISEAPASTVTGTSSFTTIGCPSTFGTAPTVSAAVSTSEAYKPTGLTLGVNSAATNPTINRIQMTLPAGMEINPAVGNGPLAACSTANINAGGGACPATSNLGTVNLTTSLLSGTQTGNVYLETPGATAATRYKLAIVVHLPGRDLVVHGSAQVNGSSNVVAGTGIGAVDSGTGRVTADFPSIPDLGFTNMTIAFNTGPRALLSNPPTCGTQTVSSIITPSSGGADATPSGSFSTSFDGAGAACPGTAGFSPTFSASLSSPVAGAHPNLTLNVTGNEKDRQLRNFALHLPVGLVAATTATTQCSQANAALGNCAAGQIVGSVSTTIGTGAETLGLSGNIYNVAPNASEPARLAAIMPVVVGPFDLGKLSIPVTTALRSNMGVDASAQLPTRYEGILVRVRSLQMVLNGTVSGNPFITNPSKCGASTITADMTPLTGAPVTGSSPITINGCPQNFGTAPTLTASASDTETATPNGLTIGINSAATNPTIKRVQMTMPNGMSINPAVGNGLAACPATTIDTNAATCPAGSEMGTVSLTTPLLGAVQTGKIYLETPGNTAATRYKLAIVVDLPGAKLVVHGSAQVNGSSDLVGGTGAVGSGTGNVTADFDDIPDLGFTNMTIAFDTGDRALLTNPETCGSQTVSSIITPNSGGANATPSASFSTSYDGAGAACPGSEGFSPTFTGSVSTSQAAGNPDLTVDVARNDKTQQLKEFNIKLPPGLVANTVDTPRCTQANAAAGTCNANTVVGSVSTAIGTGGETLTMNGTINNTEPDVNEPARLTAIIPIIVGPYDLGKLSLPVETTLVTGAQPSDLRIDTHTIVPERYEGVPVRIRNLHIVINGVVAGNGFMINPSSCLTSKTVSGEMKSTTGTTVTGSFNYTPNNCAAAQFNPSITATPTTTEAGEPVGLGLAFDVPSNSSSVKKITTTLPLGMGINPAIGNNVGGLQACTTANIDAGGAACPAASELGTVTLDTPLLPTQQQGFVYLETPGTTAATRYKLGIVIDLPGPDLIVHGKATVDGSSEIASGLGSTDTGTGQVTAEFDNLPDLQFSELAVNFYTADIDGHTALLTNPDSCGPQQVGAVMTPWSGGADATPSTTFTTSYDGAGAACPGTVPQNPTLSAQLLANANTPPVVNGEYKAGAHSDVEMVLSRPDKDQGIRKAKIFLPAGLMGSAAATVPCTLVAAAAGTCGAASQVGTVGLKIGTAGSNYMLSGTIHNMVAPSTRPARLTFQADVIVGPFNLGKIVVPIDVNLDPNDYSLFAETDPMPQRFEGVPVRIHQLTMRLFGYADQGTPASGDDKPFMSNPRTCNTNLSIRGAITSPVNYPNNVANVSGTLPQQINGCENLNLDDNTISVVNTPTDAQKPTKLGVQVTQGTTDDQATLKALTIALPGFRLNAPAADGLVACTAGQLDAQTCPNNSKVGKAWIDTSLLPVDVPDPDGGPDLHSLWGNVYLETPGTLADGSDRYKLAIQLTGKTVITIRGVARVNETTGDITTVFTGLPDIPFENFNVQLNGATNPLLLNPETCGTSTAATAMTPHSGTVKNVNSPLSVTNCVAHPFTPTVSADLTTHVAGAHPDAVFTINRDEDDQDLKSVNMTLPAGFLGSANTVPQCSLAVAAAGNCSGSSAVGTVTAKIGQAGQVLTLPGSVYLTDGANGDIAGMSIKIPAVAGPYNLGDYVTQGRVVLRPSDHGIDVFFDNVPRLFKGVPTKIQQLEIKLPGHEQNKQPFLYNASNCAPMNITGTMVSHNNATATNNVPYQATNCPGRTFSPTMSFDATTPGSATVAPAWTIKMAVGSADSTMKYTKVLLPSIMTVNVQGLATVCEPADAAAHACPAATAIGDVSITTPLLPAPVTGTVYVARTLTGSTLPDLLIEIPAPINMQIRGANSFFNGIQIQSTFDNLPDLVWSNITMHINGGPKGLLGLRANGTCGWAATSFASWSGQAATAESPVTGITNCTNEATICNSPEVVTSTKGGVKKKGSKKLKTTTTLTMAASCSPIKSFSVLYPKGAKINKKLLKYNKKQKKTKKNLKNLTGKAGGKKLVATDFQITGKNGVKIKSALPAEVRQISISSQLSTVLLPYKSFCGSIKGKGKTFKSKLKKCQNKTVTYTFVITRQNGSVLRYDHKVKAGDRKFK